jgi:hypothetical protein
MQPLARVLLQRDVHAEADLGHGFAGEQRRPRPEQALVDQGPHHIHDRRRFGPLCQFHNGGRRRERAAALEDGALGERRALPRSEQVPGIIDRAFERLVARAAAAGEQLEPLAHRLEDLRDAHHANARRRQLDRERNAVEQPHDLARGLHVRKLEAGAQPARAQREQSQRLVGGQRLDRVRPLAVEAEALAAGDEERGLGRKRLPAADRLGSVRDHLLEVVEDEQARAAAGDRVPELRDGVAAPELDAERTTDRGRDAVGGAASVRSQKKAPPLNAARRP